MPIYEFKCDECGKIEEIICSVKELDNLKPPICCKQKMYRIYSFNAGNKDYFKPIHSDSLAIMPDQVAEHRRLFPDIEIDSENRPVFTKFRQHENYLKKTGFEKVPQKIKRRSKIAK